MEQVSEDSSPPAVTSDDLLRCLKRVVELVREAIQPQVAAYEVADTACGKCCSWLDICSYRRHTRLQRQRQGMQALIRIRTLSEVSIYNSFPAEGNPLALADARASAHSGTPACE